MIIPQKRPGTSDWINYQDKQVLWWIWVVEVGEAIEVAEADEANEAAEVLRPRKSLLTTEDLSVIKFSFILIFRNKEFWGRIMKYHDDFLTFSIGGCRGQPILLFWKLVDETQMSKPPKLTRHRIFFKKRYWSFYPTEPFISTWDTLLLAEPQVLFS